MEFAPAVPRTPTQGAGAGEGPLGPRARTQPARRLWPAPRCSRDGMQTVLHFSEPSGI